MPSLWGKDGRQGRMSLLESKILTRILTRGGLMISLNFSTDINPQVFYILVGLYVVYKIIKLVWLLDVKNRIKW